MKNSGLLVGKYKSSCVLALNLWICASVHGCVAIFATPHEHKFNPGTDAHITRKRSFRLFCH